LAPACRRRAAQIADRLSRLVDRHRKGIVPEDDEGEDDQPVPVG
jgi:hypothetical protein